MRPLNRVGTSIAGLFCLLSLWVGHPSGAQAGGTIVGTVTYKGQAQEEEFASSKSPNADFCATLAKSKPDLFKNGGEIRLLRIIDVRADGALKDAIASVRDIADESFTAGFRGTEIMIEQCEFRPYTSIVVDKRNLHIVNLDPTNHAIGQTVMHNPHGMEVAGPASRTLFNIALAEKRSQLNRSVSLKHLTQSSALKLVCDQHPYMQSWLLPVTNAYYATSTGDGRFEIRDVPAGKHTLKVWHPHTGSLDLDVVVPQDGTLRIDVELPVK